MFQTGVVFVVPPPAEFRLWIAAASIPVSVTSVACAQPNWSCRCWLVRVLCLDWLWL